MTPTYKEIIKEIGTQINTRKKLLFLRTLMIIWPVLLAIVIAYISTDIYGDDYILQIALSVPNIFYIIAYVILSIIYMSVVGFIFEIEKRIWIDSFFDKREISGKASWGLAKRLLWPAIVFRIHIFFKYYLIPLLTLIVIILSPVYFYQYSDKYMNVNYIYTYVGVIVASIISYFVYTYYLRIKLRFSWFVFLDMYKGGKLEIVKIYEKMNHLNMTTKSEGFKKALIIAIGVDSVRAITTQLIVIMTEGIKALSAIPGIGNAGKMLGDLTNAYSRSLIQQVTSYAEIVAIYILYRTAYKETYGQEQEINEYMYDNHPQS